MRRRCASLQGHEFWHGVLEVLDRPRRVAGGYQLVQRYLEW